MSKGQMHFNIDILDRWLVSIGQYNKRWISGQKIIEMIGEVKQQF